MPDESDPTVIPIFIDPDNYRWVLYNKMKCCRGGLLIPSQQLFNALAELDYSKNTRRFDAIKGLLIFDKNGFIYMV